MPSLYHLLALFPSGRLMQNATRWQIWLTTKPMLQKIIPHYRVAKPHQRKGVYDCWVKYFRKVEEGPPQLGNMSSACKQLALQMEGANIWSCCQIDKEIELTDSSQARRAVLPLLRGQRNIYILWNIAEACKSSLIWSACSSSTDPGIQIALYLQFHHIYNIRMAFINFHCLHKETIDAGTIWQILFFPSPPSPWLISWKQGRIVEPEVRYYLRQTVWTSTFHNKKSCIEIPKLGILFYSKTLISCIRVCLFPFT